MVSVIPTVRATCTGGGVVISPLPWMRLYASMEPKIQTIPNADNVEPILSQSSSLTNNVEYVILQLADLDKKVKDAEEKKKQKRTELFHFATLENERQVLPRKTMRLPVGFLNKIKMQENDYLASRHPGWRKVESRKVDDSGQGDPNGRWIEYLLEKDPAYLPWTFEVIGLSGETITAGRQVQQKAPEFDQRTLQLDLPEVFDKIMTPVVVYEVNGDKLETLLSEKPELLPEIERHFAFPAPISKLSSIKETPPDG
jgi:hypothetical protein